jgi:DNA repair protein RecO (recombination protein O)
MIERAEAAVLSSRNWGETSRIVHLFSREHGLLKLMAKGARRPRSRFGAAFETGNVVQAVFYRSRSSDLHTASEASIAWRPSGREQGPERARMLAAGLEIPLRAAAPETPIMALYRNLCRFLQGIDSAPEEEHPVLLLDFALHSLKNLGYHPVLDRCLSCGQRLPGRVAGFSLGGGGLVCHGCGTKFRDLAAVSGGHARWLAGWPGEVPCPLHRAEALRLVGVLLSFLNCQLSDRPKLKCFRLLA